MDTATVKLLANVTELVVRDMEANVLSKAVRATSECLHSGHLELLLGQLLTVPL